MTVNLTRIYTRLGDDGETHLGDMSRVPKTDPRIAAYGTVDELNAQLGLTLTVAGLQAVHAEWLRRIQNDLFDVGDYYYLNLWKYFFYHYLTVTCCIWVCF